MNIIIWKNLINNFSILYIKKKRELRIKNIHWKLRYQLKKLRILWSKLRYWYFRKIK